MLSIINSCTIVGIEGFSVCVEVNVSDGMPGFDIVGLPDTSVKEARERVKAAIVNSGFSFQATKIVVNLAPADLRKEGTLFDLPIAIGYLIATNQCPGFKLHNAMVIGELSLNGEVRSVCGMLSVALKARSDQITELFCPAESAPQAAIVQELNVFPLDNLRQFVEHLIGEQEILQSVSNIDLKTHQQPINDFSHIQGQEYAKRALEVAAAGGHNCLMIGPPGSGKTLLARSIPGILPSMSFEEALEVTQVHSVANTVNSPNGLVLERPFRAPHHSISFAGLVGGGHVPKPGEVSLAHHGVLFLDELPEFARHTLEHLRQPLEDGFLTISRARLSCTFPASFMFIASMNPCPCGYFGSSDHQCTCTATQILRYRQRISGPLLDRVDIHISVPRVTYQQLTDHTNQERSEVIRKRVEFAREVQISRLKDSKIYYNSAMTHTQVQQYCESTSEATNLLQIAYKKLKFSARAYDRVLKVSRTIADLAGSDLIEEQHIAEAIQYREGVI